MTYSTYIIAGVLALLFFFVFSNNKRRDKRRKSRKFMEGYSRKKDTTKED